MGRKIDRDKDSVRYYVKYRLGNKEKTRRGRFSAEESKKVQVMDHLFEAKNEALCDAENVGITSKVWVQLANLLNRPDDSIFFHWSFRIQPLLIRYEAGVLDRDFRIPLLEYCIINNIKYTQNATWVEIYKEPEFVGTTFYYLSSIYKSFRRLAKGNFYKGKADQEVTTKALLEYQKTLKALPKPKARHKIKYGKRSFGIL